LVTLHPWHTRAELSSAIGTCAYNGHSLYLRKGSGYAVKSELQAKILLADKLQELARSLQAQNKQIKEEDLQKRQSMLADFQTSVEDIKARSAARASRGLIFAQCEQRSNSLFSTLLLVHVEGPTPATRTLASCHVQGLGQRYFAGGDAEGEAGGPAEIRERHADAGCSGEVFRGQGELPLHSATALL
jgi:hypothetical protein